MREYGVARMTARQALGQLIQDGTAEARKGSGVYVRAFRPIVRDGITRLSAPARGRSVWMSEIDTRTLDIDNLDVYEGNPPARIAVLLELQDTDRVLVRGRRYVLNGKPVLLSTSWLPAALAAGTRIAEPDTGPGGTYARLRDLGHTPARFREDLTARMPEPAEVELLELPPGAPVVHIVRVVYDAGGTPVEVDEMRADASAYVFRYEFDAPVPELGLVRGLIRPTRPTDSSRRRASAR
jgi:GntR family transcriptional regulator